MGIRRGWLRLAIGLALLACCAASCKRKAAAKSDSGITEDRVEESGTLRLGDDVIVEHGKAMFIPGKVARVEGNTIGYATGLGDMILEAPLASVYAIRPGHEAKEQPGDYAICRASGRFWKACQVKRIQGSLFVCEDDDGKSLNVDPDDVILPSAATQTNIKEKLERNAARRAFLTAAMEAGKPVRPAGWKPKTGDEVVAPFVSSWNGGRITQATATSVTIAWDDKSGPSARPAGEVVPKPRGPQSLAVGRFVLVRPPASYSTRWSYARVESAKGSALVVVNDEGIKRTVKDTDVIPIAR